MTPSIAVFPTSRYLALGQCYFAKKYFYYLLLPPTMGISSNLSKMSEYSFERNCNALSPRVRKAGRPRLMYKPHHRCIKSEVLASSDMALVAESKPRDLTVGRGAYKFPVTPWISLAKPQSLPQNSEFGEFKIHIVTLLVTLFCFRDIQRYSSHPVASSYPSESSASTNSFTMLPSMPQGTPTTAVFT